MQSVRISPEFFAKAKNDYADWRWAWVRELAQNSIDAPGSDLVSFKFSTDGTNTYAECFNNGTPMTQEVLLDKFLSLGGSGKNFGDTVGGFGKAKEVIGFCHVSWRIETGGWIAEGIGGNFDLIPAPTYLDGTRTTVTMRGDEVDDLREATRKLASYTQWGGEFQLDGEVLDSNMRKGSLRRDLGFGTVYTNRSARNVLVVRMGGIPMFVRHCSPDRCVLVELKGRSDEVLTANRDGLVWRYSSELNDFITEMAVDKRSALKQRYTGPEYIVYDGDKLVHKKEQEVSPSSVAALVNSPAEFVIDTSEGTVAVEVATDTEQKAPSYEHGGTVIQYSRKTNFNGFFVIKNETGMKIPEYYRPESPTFSGYSVKLTRTWARLMYTLHVLFQRDSEFGVGFIFSEDTLAEHESGEHGTMYYINPAEVIEQTYTHSKSLRKRHKLDAKGKKKLLALAMHEFVHGLGYGPHNEDYAAKLTEVTGAVMGHMKIFNWCFAGR